GRGTEDEAATQRRLNNARREIAQYGLFDYVVVNDEVNQAHERMRSIVFAERCRRRRHARRCEELLAQAQVALVDGTDRKSTRLNSSHVKTSYAVFCL